MKKTWTNPELQSLEITATAGGTELSQTPDGPADWANGRWWTPGGTISS